MSREVKVIGIECSTDGVEPLRSMGPSKSEAQEQPQFSIFKPQPGGIEGRGSENQERGEF
jgi:hypothetical protein